MWLHYLLVVMLIVSIDASQRKLYEQKLSSVDVELISFANTSLVKYFRHDEHVRPAYIVQIKTAVN